ncbi:hypothetical protein [Paenibacillus sp. PL91]|nr:hypothetical protein [Paenibacillus sp. PL91]MBC9202393.1 hypothetical protein [Paenibacillus sp. PL91]
MEKKQIIEMHKPIGVVIIDKIYAELNDGLFKQELVDSFLALITTKP